MKNVYFLSDAHLGSRAIAHGRTQERRFYRNKAFEPLKPDAEIQAMVDVPEELINRADSAINSIRTAPERYREPILKLRDQIMEVATTVYKHKLFLRQYFKLPAKQRKGMFKQTK